MGMTDKSLCDSCTNIGCEFQSGIVRTKCAFYMPPQLEPDNCGNYVVQDSTTKNDLAVEKTDMIDKSNFSQEQYKTDLQSAYDSGYEQAKNDLEVDWESYKDVDGNSLDDLILEVLQNNFDCGNTYGYKVADEIIGLLPSVTPQEPRWIPVTERLPKEKTAVLLSCDDMYLARLNPCIGWRNGNYWHTFSAKGSYLVKYPIA